MINRKKSTIFAVAKFLATAGGIGHSPYAPGTLGSLPGVITGLWFAVGIASQPFFYWPMLIAFTAVSIWSVIIYETTLNTHDESKIVIDEVIGQTIALLPAGILKSEWLLTLRPTDINSETIVYALSGFCLFRFFDILKPGFIGRLDRENHTPLGTCLDDIMAGLVSAAVLTVAMYLVP